MIHADFSVLCTIIQSDDVIYAYEGAFNIDEVQNWLDRQTERYKEYGFRLWVVVLKETGRMIGQYGLMM